MTADYKVVYVYAFRQWFVQLKFELFSIWAPRGVQKAAEYAAALMAKKELL